MNRIRITFILAILVPFSTYADGRRIVSSSTDTQALLATGFSSQKERFEEGCVTGDVKFSGAQSGELSFSQVTSISELSSSLGFQAGTKFRYGIVSVKAAAKFFSASQSSNYSLSATYNANYHFKNEILTNPKLSDIGKLVRENDERWFETCGDEYVWQKELGAKFFFSIRVDFASELDKQYFEGSFSLAAPVLEISAGLQTAKDRLSKRTTVTINALQIGGSIEKLSSIFGNTDDRMAFVQCSIGEYEKCHNVLRSALDYATDVEKGFPSQISPMEGTESQGGPAVLTYFTKSYKGAGIYPKSYPHLSEAVKLARTDLALLFEDFFKDKVRIQQLLYSKSIRLSPNQKYKLRQAEQIIEENKTRILNASQVCYETPLECPGEVKTLRIVETALKPIDPLVFIISPESFSQFCDISKLPQPNVALKMTVDALITEAKRIDTNAFQASGENGDECLITEDVIMRSKRLLLSKMGIKDLRPLQQFTHLEELDLTENEISDLSELADFKHLSILKLGRNKLKSVKALEGLTALTYLDLSENKILDSSPLTNLLSLEKLDLRNNDPRVKCPLPNPDRCLIGDYVTSNTFIRLPMNEIPRAQHTMTKLQDGSVLIVGGWDEKASSAEIYDSQTRFRLLGLNTLKARRGHTATLLGDGMVLLAGGWGANRSGELYHPQLNKFEPTLEMSTARSGHTATLLKNGTVLLAGGSSNIIWTGSEGDALATAEIYDPVSKTFAAVGSMKFRRCDHTATLLENGKVLIAGGFSGNSGLYTAELYDPETRQFQHAPSRMTRGRGAHTATLLKNGNVLITGGWWDENNNATTSAEIFEAEEGVFRRIQGEPLKYGRAWHEASLLSDGRVLVIGGLTEWTLDHENTDKSLDSGEVFDPVSELFTAIPQRMSAPRVFHKMVVLDDRMALITGGADKKAKTSAEIYEYRR